MTEKSAAPFGRVFGLIVGAALALAACGSGTVVWLNDFDQAQEAARKKNKNIFLYLSADEGNEASQALKETVFNSPEFLKEIGKSYVPVNLDFSPSLFEAMNTGEDATEEQKAEAEKIRARLENNLSLANKYQAQAAPAYYLLTKEGYVIAAPEPAEDVDDPAEFIALIKESDEASKTLRDLLQRIEKEKGPKKAEAIDALFEASDPRFRYLLSDYFPQVMENDPENTTGLLGKYELQNAYLQASDLFEAGYASQASSVFSELAENGHLSEQELQETLYLSAFFLANGPDATLEGVVGLLNRALEAAPESDAAQSIREIIDQLTQDNGSD